MTRCPPMRFLKKNGPRTNGAPTKWPSAGGWQPVAEEAVRAAHAAHCAALVLRGKAAYDETARFLVRRGDMLLALTESLITESRCEERLRMLTCQEVLEGMKQAEEQLNNKVKLLLSRNGLKLQMVKLLE